MKKILALFGAIGLTATSAATVISCGQETQKGMLDSYDAIDYMNPDKYSVEQIQEVWNILSTEEGSKNAPDWIKEAIAVGNDMPNFSKKEGSEQTKMANAYLKSIYSSRSFDTLLIQKNLRVDKGNLVEYKSEEKQLKLQDIDGILELLDFKSSTNAPGWPTNKELLAKTDESIKKHFEQLTKDITDLKNSLNSGNEIKGLLDSYDAIDYMHPDKYSEEEVLNLQKKLFGDHGNLPSNVPQWFKDDLKLVNSLYDDSFSSKPVEEQIKAFEALLRNQFFSNSNLVLMQEKNIFNDYHDNSFKKYESKFDDRKFDELKNIFSETNDIIQGKFNFFGPDSNLQEIAKKLFPKLDQSILANYKELNKYVPKLIDDFNTGLNLLISDYVKVDYLHPENYEVEQLREVNNNILKNLTDPANHEKLPTWFKNLLKQWEPLRTSDNGAAFLEMKESEQISVLSSKYKTLIYNVAIELVMYQKNIKDFDEHKNLISFSGLKDKINFFDEVKNQMDIDNNHMSKEIKQRIDNILLNNNISEYNILSEMYRYTDKMVQDLENESNLLISNYQLIDYMHPETYDPSQLEAVYSHVLNQTDFKKKPKWYQDLSQEADVLSSNSFMVLGENDQISVMNSFYKTFIYKNSVRLTMFRKNIQAFDQEGNSINYTDNKNKIADLNLWESEMNSIINNLTDDVKTKIIFIKKAMDQDLVKQLDQLNQYIEKLIYDLEDQTNLLINYYSKIYYSSPNIYSPSDLEVVYRHVLNQTDSKKLPEWYQTLSNKVNLLSSGFIDVLDKDEQISVVESLYKIIIYKNSIRLTMLQKDIQAFDQEGNSINYTDNKNKIADLNLWESEMDSIINKLDEEVKEKIIFIKELIDNNLVDELNDINNYIDKLVNELSEQ